MTAREAMAECLADCGIPPEVREQILACEGCIGRQLCLLNRARATLMHDLHQAQRRIDLMDLLIDSLKKEYKER